MTASNSGREIASDPAYREPLRHLQVAVSVSESSDLAQRGFGPEHLVDALTETARHLLALGAGLVYGGDLRAEGFTHVLGELVLRHKRDVSTTDARTTDDGTAVRNVLAWPVLRTTPPHTLEALMRALEGVAQMEWLDASGNVHGPADAILADLAVPELTTVDWHEGLSAMRRYVTKTTDARVLVGGRRSDYKGRMAGLLEEALCSLRVCQPLFIIGGFGGVAADIATSLGLTSPDESVARRGGGITMRDFAAGVLPSDGFLELQLYNAESLHNGLSREENGILATTPHIDHAVVLLLRGLVRLTESPT